MAIINLPPQPTSFIGREYEIAQITARLDDPACRLLTLVGPGGIGKTRLALEVASRVAMRFADGVYFVPLQPLHDIEDIVTTIIDALPLQLTDVAESRPLLLNYLREKHLLLLLDNFEHLLAGVDIVTDILSTTTQVVLIVTSREWLNLQAEQVWPVRGLDVPEGPEDVPQLHSAVQLFVERARRIQPDFSFDVCRDAVIHICQLVDGLPLALELAASWVRAMSSETIADEIRHNIDFLTTNQRDMPERHRSMRAVFDHSWHLLSEDERTAFRSLSVFRSGFTAEAAKQVVGASLQTLTSLIDKSLVRLGSNGRYDLHELLRQYASEQLEVAGQSERTLDHHGEFYAGFMHKREADLKGPRQIETLNEIEADFDNVRAAWQRAVQSHRHEWINASVESLFLFCILRSRFLDHRTLFEQALTAFASHDGAEPTPTWGRILARSYRFFTTHFAEPQPEAIAKGEIALQIARSQRDQLEMAFCLYLLGKLSVPASDAQALVLLEESLQLYAVVGEVFYRAYLLQEIGQCRNYLRQIEQVIAPWQESLDLCRSHKLQSPMGRILSMLGFIEAFGKGHFDEGERYVREAMNLYRSMNSPGETARYARWLSAIVFVRGGFDEAQQLAEECRAIAHEVYDFEYMSPSSAISTMIFNVHGDYRRGEELGRESYRYGVTPTDLFFAGWSLGCAYGSLGDLQTARHYLRFALQQADNTIHQPGFMVLCVPIAAFICSQEGKPERSVELLALAFTHPRSPTGWLERWPLMTQLCAEWETQLGSEAYTTAWEHGKSLDLEFVTQQLLAELESEQSILDLSINQALPDPLSPRELEVLALIADGYTNREIADQLHVGVSTVKKHINHIYSKLAVVDRAGAVLCARASHLIL
jgi:predicted ATPase/DNA-binding CsgD family transcriptional regulator